MSRIASNRRLRRLRGLLGLLAAATALCVVLASKLESTGRAVAAIGALAGLVAWLVVLDIEGRMADRLERRPVRRRLAARRGHHRSERVESRRRVA